MNWLSRLKSFGFKYPMLWSVSFFDLMNDFVWGGYHNAQTCILSICLTVKSEGFRILLAQTSYRKSWSRRLSFALQCLIVNRTALLVQRSSIKIVEFPWRNREFNHSQIWPMVGTNLALKRSIVTWWKPSRTCVLSNDSFLTIVKW